MPQKNIKKILYFYSKCKFFTKLESQKFNLLYNANEYKAAKKLQKNKIEVALNFII